MCQADELLPRGTSALRLAFNMALGARLSVEASAGGRVVAHGLRASGWRGSDVTVPLTSTVSEAQHVTICMSFGVSNEPVGLIGGQTQPAKAARDDGKPLPGRVKIEYLHTGSRSWWSLAPDVVRRMGLGRAWSGSWVALLVAALMLATLAVGGWIAVRELR